MNQVQQFTKPCFDMSKKLSTCPFYPGVSTNPPILLHNEICNYLTLVNWSKWQHRAVSCTLRSIYFSETCSVVSTSCRPSGWVVVLVMILVTFVLPLMVSVFVWVEVEMRVEPPPPPAPPCAAWGLHAPPPPLFIPLE